MPAPAGGARAAFAARVDLCRRVLHSGERLRFRVEGTSMLPALWPGEVVCVEARDIATLRIGDVALYGRAGCFSVHRVVAFVRDGTGAIVPVTRGDALVAADGPLAAAELLGVVTAVRRRGSEHVLPPRGPVALAVSWLAARTRPLGRCAVGAARRLRDAAFIGKALGKVAPLARGVSPGCAFRLRR